MTEEKLKITKTETFTEQFIPKRTSENRTIAREREKHIRFKEIFYGEQRIKLKSPITVKGVVADKICSLYYAPLDIVVSSPTLAECEDDFQEVFYVLYEEYAREVDDKLSEGARELKRKLLDLVE